MSDDYPLDPITAKDAAELLGRSASTIRKWAERYNVRRVGKVGGRVYFDYFDLMIIEKEIWRGNPVPPTPEEREAIRFKRNNAAG
jgi:hypothetical protein